MILTRGGNNIIKLREYECLRIYVNLIGIEEQFTNHETNVVPAKRVTLSNRTTVLFMVALGKHPEIEENKHFQMNY